MDELKPCPFCGGEARFWNGMQQWGVECTNCGAMIRADSYSQEEAAGEWNMRNAYEYKDCSNCVYFKFDPHEEPCYSCDRNYQGTPSKWMGEFNV